MDKRSTSYYLSRVTLKEAWNEDKASHGGGIFVGLLVVCVMALLMTMGYLLVDGSPTAKGSSKFDDVLKSVPWWIIAPAIISILVWLLRGRTIRVPTFDLKLWLTITAVQFIVFSGFAVFPWPLMIVACYFINAPLLLLDRLIDIGRNKVEQESKSSGDSH